MARETAEREVQLDRRVVIAGVASLVAGALVKAESADASPPAPFLLCHTNTAAGPTSLLRTGTSGGEAAITVVDLSRSPALVGASGPFHPHDLAISAGYGVVGVGAIHPGDFGVVGTTAPLADAWEQLSTDFGGVAGIVGEGFGVTGIASQPGAVGVAAINREPGGTAFRALGSLELSTVGAATIPAGAESHTVTHPGVDSSSHVTVTFTRDPRGLEVEWIDSGPGEFTIHLNRRARADLPVTYSFLDPA